MVVIMYSTVCVGVSNHGGQQTVKCVQMLLFLRRMADLVSTGSSNFYRFIGLREGIKWAKSQQKRSEVECRIGKEEKRKKKKSWRGWMPRPNPPDIPPTQSTKLF